MSLPERHLDAAYAPGSLTETGPRPPLSRILAAMSLPLFFVVAFTVCYVSALHAPVPHDLALTVAGPAAQTQQVAAGVERQAGAGFDVTQTQDTAAALRMVEDRDAVGAIVLGTDSSVTVLTADGEGRIAASAVTSVGQRIAQQLGTTATVRDVAPLTEQDPNGVGLFYFVIISTIGGYLSITVLYQTLARASRRVKLTTAVVAAVLTPIIAIAALSFSIGIEGMDFGQLAAVVGIDAVYALVVALLAIAFNELLGQAAIFAIVVVVLALNFPSTGGSVPESMLPPFWQAIHAAWFGSGALESFRSIIFFGGNGFAWPFVRLLIWLVGAAAVTAGALFRNRRRAAREQAPSVDTGADPMPAAATATATAPAV